MFQPGVGLACFGENLKYTQVGNEAPWKAVLYWI